MTDEISLVRRAERELHAPASLGDHRTAWRRRCSGYDRTTEGSDGDDTRDPLADGPDSGT